MEFYQNGPALFQMVPDKILEIIVTAELVRLQAALHRPANFSKETDHILDIGAVGIRPGLHFPGKAQFIVVLVAVPVKQGQGCCGATGMLCVLNKLMLNFHDSLTSFPVICSGTRARHCTLGRACFSSFSR